MTTTWNDVYEGVWERLLLSLPGQTVDTLTAVSWIQGPRYFVDLRQPRWLRGNVQATCLTELQMADAQALAFQQGFAGTFKMLGDIATWGRAIDFQPPGDLGDRGRLEANGELLIEHGVEADYIEYWQRDAANDRHPCIGAHFVSVDDNCPVILVRHGARFGYARARTRPIERNADLVALLKGADLATARALLDCEIALGQVTCEGWRIDRSTLPWREGALLIGPDAAFDEKQLAVADIDAEGQVFTRALELTELHGEWDTAYRTSVPATASKSTRPLMNEPFREVPVVDIAALGGPDLTAERAVVEQLRQAASSVGFLYVTGHGIAPAVIERVQHAAKRFFDEPPETKLKSYIGQSSNHRGYVPEGEEVLGGNMRDRKEAFDLALDLPAEYVPADHPMLGPNQWPDLAGFREDVMGYYAAAFAVGQRLLRGFAMALGQPANSLDALVMQPPSQLRLLHYPFQPGIEDAPGIGAHTDYECFTLLLTTGPGLEVMNQAGQWIDAPPVPGGLVVNIGDMLEFWSNGAFVATSHRVRKVPEERYSFPLFFALDYDVALQPLGAAAGAETIRSGEHLYAQTIQTFRYLQERATRGDISLPENARQLATFGQVARHKEAAE